MKRILTSIAALSMVVPMALAEVLVDEKFDQGALNETTWNDGGGFRYNADAQNVTLTTFDGVWGSKGDNTGVAGLNSTVGSASFTVAQDGTNTLGGHFMVGTTKCCDTAYAVVRVDFAAKGAGSYEVVWNNSGSEVEFKTASGWSGTIKGDTYVWIVDGNTDDPHWGESDAEPNVTVGDPAGRFGFWTLDPQKFAAIDNVIIADTTTLNAQATE